jgi:hypothetical protein
VGPDCIQPWVFGLRARLSLAYDSGQGNGPFGFGWSLSVPAIARKTDKGLPQYATAKCPTISFHQHHSELGSDLTNYSRIFRMRASSLAYIRR